MSRYRPGNEILLKARIECVDFVGTQFLTAQIGRDVQAQVEVATTGFTDLSSDLHREDADDRVAVAQHGRIDMGHESMTMMPLR